MMFKKILLSTIVTMCLCGLTVAQERPDRQERSTENSPEYEHLKVLESMIGVFEPAGMNPNMDVRISATWSRQKRMIEWTAKIRAKGTEEWRDHPRKQYFYWNESEKRIERLDIRPNRGGRVDTYEFLPEGENQFAFKLISSNRPGGMTSQQWTVTSEGIAIEGTRTNAEGLNSQMRVNLTRVE